MAVLASVIHTRQVAGRTEKRTGSIAAGHFPRAQELQISAIGLGTRLGFPDEATNESYVDAVIQAARRGCNLFDTAGAYCSIAAETLTGGRAFDEVHPWLSGVLDRSATHAQRMIQLVRSTPGVTAALVGMSRPEHVVANLALAEIPAATRSDFEKLVPHAAPQLPWLS